MELNKQNMIRIFKIAAGIILFYVGLQNLSAVMGAVKVVYGLLSPFVIGAAIAFILNVPMRFVERTLFGWLERKKERKPKFIRPISLVITLALVVGVIFIVMFIIGPELGQTIKAAIDQAIPFFQDLQVKLLELFAEYPDIESWIQELTIDWQSLGQKLLTFAGSGVGSIVNSTFSVATSIVSGVVNFVMAFIFAIYLLLQKEKLGRQVKQILYAVLKEQTADRILSIGQLSGETFSKFLSGQCLEAVILGTMFVIAMSILRFPYALMIGVLIAFTALIPVFGAFIGCVIGAFLILIVDPMQAFWFIILFVVLQQIEGNLIYPHVVGGSIGLPSIWVLVAVSLGGSVMGVAGMLVFIPGFSVLYTLLREYVYKRLAAKKVDKDKWRLSDGKEKRKGKAGEDSANPGAESEAFLEEKDGSSRMVRVGGECGEQRGGSEGKQAEGRRGVLEKISGAPSNKGADRRNSAEGAAGSGNPGAANRKRGKRTE